MTKEPIYTVMRWEGPDEGWREQFDGTLQEVRNYLSYRDKRERDDIIVYPPPVNISEIMEGA